MKKKIKNSAAPDHEYDEHPDMPSFKQAAADHIKRIKKMKTKSKKTKPRGLFQIRVDCGNLPPYQATKMLEKIKTNMNHGKFKKKYGDIIVTGLNVEIIRII